MREVALIQCGNGKVNTEPLETALECLSFAGVRTGGETVQICISHKTLILHTFQKDCDRQVAVPVTPMLDFNGARKRVPSAQAKCASFRIKRCRVGFASPVAKAT